MIRSSGRILNKAVKSSNNEVVRLLIDAGATVNWHDEAPLVEVKTVEIARMLVEAGADVNGLGYNVNGGYSTALCAAVGNRNINLARYLINAGADVNAPIPDDPDDEDWRECTFYPCPGSPLELAVHGKQRELVELLLEHGAQVQERLGAGALHDAISSGDLDGVGLLVDAGADVNALVDGFTALRLALHHDHSEVVAFLVNRGANIDAPGQFYHGLPKTVLTAAVEKDDLKLVEFFLNAGVDVNIPSFSYYGCTALEVAKSLPVSSEIVDLLIAKGARDSALTLNPHHKVQLYDAVWKGDLDRVQFLINLGLQIDMQMIEYPPLDNYTDDPEQKTILHLAVYTDWPLKIELFRFLLGKVKDVNAQMKVSVLSSLLVRAAERQSFALAEMLIDAGADVNRCDDRGTPLLCAVPEAAYRGDLKVVRFLLRKGADVNGCDHSGDTPLLCAVRKADDGALKLVRFLLSEGADVNAISEGDYGCTTALQESLQKAWLSGGSLDMAYLLLAHGAKINAPLGFRGSSELAYAAGTGSIQLVRELLDRGADVNSAPSFTGYTALQAAIGFKSTNMNMVQLLIEKGAEINAPGRYTALQLAIMGKHFQLVLLLVKAGADINAQTLENPDYFPARCWSPDITISPHCETALELAAWGGYLDILHVLLKAGADMHLPIEERYVKAIDLARQGGHIVVEEILEGWAKGEGARGNLADQAQNSQRQRVE